MPSRGDDYTVAEHRAGPVGVGPGGPSATLDGGANLLGDLAMRSSTRWPRIYRPPRARGGHVILDLCVHDAEAEAEARRQQQAGLSLGAAFGKLERHVSLSHSGALYASRITSLVRTNLSDIEHTRTFSVSFHYDPL